ncbi:flagellar hook-associated protein FlgL [Terriglobus saanensis]|uniref:Flagellin domain protein n=1 Tax=Terriglobus saanensis (strain ATCC BAA-1853 / DSM 23119 / SP1PR4) TaxID=401053 RepID=E8V5N7_TERSS|nr:flagellar hook-associated protein FlgL [Terriglobus saanensis]ADV82646.1 flagellin domain protein [Terriglobus saanensis SP1PR4]
MRIDPTYTNSLVASLNSLSASQQKISQEMSTGLRLTSLGDDPLAAGQNETLTSAISQMDSFVKTVSNVSNRMQAADTALSSTVTALDNALSLATAGANSTLTSTQLKSLAESLTSIRDSVLSLANSSYQGNFLFAGTAISSQPFTLDDSTTPATVTYSGDDATQTVTSTTGQQLATSVPGSQLFGTGTANDVFAALNTLIADYQTGVAPTSATADLATLHDSLTNLSQQRSILDSSMSRLSAAGTYATNQETNLQVAQSTLISSNTASLATQLSAVTTQQSALRSTIAIVEKGSLFDYL